MFSCMSVSSNQKLYDKIKMINNIRVSELNVLQTTCDIESMSEINNKQRVGHGLTHVADETFNFFALFTRTQSLLQSDCIHIYQT